MNEGLHDLIVSMNCTIINPVQKSLTDKTTCGWHLKSTSNLRKDYHLKEIEKHILENKLNYTLVDSGNNEFFIYLN